MTRCIKEGYASVSDPDYGCTYVLRNASCLTACYIGIADSIKQGGLTMVNVTHDADYRITKLECCLVLLFLLKELCNNILLNFLLAEDIILDGNLLCLLVAKLCIRRYHLACKEQLLDNNTWLHLKLVRKLLDGKSLRNNYLLNLILGCFLLRLRLNKCALSRLRSLKVRIIDKFILPILGIIISAGACSAASSAVLGCSIK